MSIRMRTRFGMVRVERRITYSRLFSASMTLAALLLSLAAVAAIFLLMGLDPIQSFKVIAESLIIPRLLLESIKQSIPICLSALGLAIAFKMNFWNIGAEGQLYMGMTASTAMVLLHAYYGLLHDILLPAMFISSFIAGGLWCLVAGALRARMNVNEILTTLMLNYVAILIVDYLVHGPWRDPRGYGFPLSIEFPRSARLLLILENPAYTGLAISIAAAAAAYYILDHTKLGFEIKVVGQSVNVARYAGVDVSRVMMLGSFLAGGLAGIGGLSIVSGIIGRLRPEASPGYGYTAIIVASLAGLNPWLIILASIFFGGLLTAGAALQASMNIPRAATQAIQAVIFLFIIAGEFFKRYRIVVERGAGEG